MTIPSYPTRLRTPCVHTLQTLIMASESGIHKHNKVLRLESTRLGDSLNNLYCWQQATPPVCVRAPCVMCLLDTFPREKWQRCWYSCLKVTCSALAEAESPPPGLGDHSERVCPPHTACTSGFTEAAEGRPKRTGVEKDMGVFRASQGFVCVTKPASLDDKV